MVKYSVLIFILIPLITLQEQYFNCNITEGGCSNHGQCMESGLCLCDIYYYGTQCTQDGQTDSGGLTLIILLWLILSPLIFYGGYIGVEKLRLFYEDYITNKSQIKPEENNQIELQQQPRQSQQSKPSSLPVEEEEKEEERKQQGYDGSTQIIQLGIPYSEQIKIQSNHFENGNSNKQSSGNKNAMNQQNFDLKENASVRNSLEINGDENNNPFYEQQIKNSQQSNMSSKRNTVQKQNSQRDSLNDERRRRRSSRLQDKKPTNNFIYNNSGGYSSKQSLKSDDNKSLGSNASSKSSQSNLRKRNSQNFNITENQHKPQTQQISEMLFKQENLLQFDEEENEEEKYEQEQYEQEEDYQEEEEQEQYEQEEDEQEQYEQEDDQQIVINENDQESNSSNGNSSNDIIQQKEDIQNQSSNYQSSSLSEVI